MHFCDFSLLSKMSFTRSTATTIFLPLVVIKTQIEWGNGRTMQEVAKRIYQTEGISAFWRGLFPTLLRYLRFLLFFFLDQTWFWGMVHILVSMSFSIVVYRKILMPIIQRWKISLVQPLPELLQQFWHNQLMSLDVIYR